MNTVMVNIHDAKAKLSEYLEAAARGDRVLICKRNRPVAELRAIPAARAEPRPVGGVQGLAVPASFFEPLPEGFVDSFYGDAGRSASAARVAERSPRHDKGRQRRQGRR